MRRGRSKSHDHEAEQSNEQELKHAGIALPTSSAAAHPAPPYVMATSQLPTSAPNADQRVAELERDLREMQLKLSGLLSQGVVPPLEREVSSPQSHMRHPPQPTPYYSIPSEHKPSRSVLPDPEAEEPKYHSQPKVGVRDIPTFDPTTNKTQTAARWLKQVARVAIAAGWDDVTTISLCGMKMDGSAADWFSRKGSKMRTWSEFCIGLKKRYGIPLSRTLVRDGMMQDEKESVDDFIDRIRSVLAPYGEMAEDDTLVGNVFRKGLRPELQRPITDRFNDTEMNDVSVDDWLNKPTVNKSFLTLKRLIVNDTPALSNRRLYLVVLLPLV